MQADFKGALCFPGNDKGRHAASNWAHDVLGATFGPIATLLCLRALRPLSKKRPRAAAAAAADDDAADDDAAAAADNDDDDDEDDDDDDADADAGDVDSRGDDV